MRRETTFLRRAGRAGRRRFAGAKPTTRARRLRRRLRDRRSPPPSAVWRTPGAIGTKYNRESLTYRELDHREPASASSEDLGGRAWHAGRSLRWPVSRDGGGNACDPEGRGPAYVPVDELSAERVTL